MDHKIMAEIADLCIRVSQQTKHDAFFNYSGHVNTLDVSIYINGWSNGGKCERFEISRFKDYEDLLTTVHYKLTNLLQNVVGA